MLYLKVDKESDWLMGRWMDRILKYKAIRTGKKDDSGADFHLLA